MRSAIALRGTSTAREGSWIRECEIRFVSVLILRRSTCTIVHEPPSTHSHPLLFSIGPVAGRNSADGAGVVAIAYSHSIGVGSPVARLGADGRRRTGSAVRIRRSRCRAGNPGTRRQGRRCRNSPSETYEGIPIMQSLHADRHRGSGRHARAAVRAVGAVDAVCVLGAGPPSSQRASEV